MSRSSIGFRLVLFIPVILCLGCFKIPKIKTLTEAQEYFLKVLKEEHQLEPKVIMLKETLWIYLPIEEPIFDFKNSPAGPQKSNSPQEKLALNYLDGNFIDRQFYIEYAINKNKNYLMDNGVSSATSEKFIKIQNAILTTLARAYTDLDHIPGDIEYSDGHKDETHKTLVKNYIGTDKPPVFISLVISDIKRGVEINSIFNFADYKRYMTESIPQEEFAKRTISEIKGDKTIIRDKEGMHVDYHDIGWPEFLIKQTLNRIRFRYQQSDFVPGNDTEEEILKLLNETLGSYQFEDFDAVKLRNLGSQKDYLFDKTQLKTFKATSESK